MHAPRGHQRTQEVGAMSFVYLFLAMTRISMSSLLNVGTDARSRGSSGARWVRSCPDGPAAGVTDWQQPCEDEVIVKFVIDVVLARSDGSIDDRVHDRSCGDPRGERRSDVR